MVQAVSEIRGTGYRVKLESFEGPLDLLLYLIKRDEIDIYDIPIARVTAQYLEHVKMIQEFDLEIAGEFLLMAATLMRIKSKLLLPKQLDDDEEDEGDPRDELVHRLLEYRKYKRVAEQLKVQADERMHRLGRLIPDDMEIPAEEPEFLIPIDLVGLLRTFANLLERAPSMEPYEVILDEYTLEEKMELVASRLESEDRLDFSTLFCSDAKRIEIVVTFVAILELMRLQKVRLSQNGLFGRIWVRRREEEDGDGSEQQLDS